MRKSKKANAKRDDNHSKALRWIEKELQSEKSPGRIETLLSMKKKAELWVKMEKGDVGALAELSVQFGLMSKEVAELVKKEAEEYADDGKDYEEEAW